MAHTSSSTPLDQSIMPYITRGALRVEDLLDAVKLSDLPLAFDALLEMARTHRLVKIEQKVLEIKGWEKEQRERAAREVVAEVRPVLEVSESVSLAKTRREPQIVLSRRWTGRRVHQCACASRYQICVERSYR